MFLDAKIDLVVRVLDEVYTVEYEPTPLQKTEAIKLVCAILEGYTAPQLPTPADNAILEMQTLVGCTDIGVLDKFRRLAVLAENALTDLHRQFAENV